MQILWQEYIQLAAKECKADLTEDQESYLVFLLMRYMREQKLISNIIALEFLESFNKSGSLKHDALRDVGDKCLLFSGFFPKLSIKRRVSIGYFIDIGRSAYHELANINNAKNLGLSELYNNLAQNFINLSDILQNLKQGNNQLEEMDLLQNFELYEKYNSQAALDRLQKMLNKQKDNVIIMRNYERRRQ